MFEAEVTKIQGAKMNLETQIMALESAQVNQETMLAMQQAGQAMKQIHGTMCAPFCLFSL